MQRYTEIPYTAIFRWHFGTRYDDSTFTVSVLFKFHKNISFAASSSWIIIDSLGHLYVCQWVVRTLLKVKKTKNKTYACVKKQLTVYMGWTNPWQFYCFSHFHLIYQNSVPWYVLHREWYTVIRIVPWRCVSLHLYVTSLKS